MTKLSLVLSACPEPDLKESSVPDAKKNEDPVDSTTTAALINIFIKKNCIIYNVKGVTRSIEPTKLQNILVSLN